MHPAVVRVLAVTACWAWLAAPARSQKVKAQKWEDFYPDQRHKSHQSSIPTEVTDKFRATSSPYQRVPVDKRKPQDLPPYVGTAVTPQCIEVLQSGKSLSARNQGEICDDWAIGEYWLTEEREAGKGVWRTSSGTHTIRYQADEYGWWIHRNRDRQGYGCLDLDPDRNTDPLGCAGFGHKHWAGCVVRPCAEGGDGIEPKLRRLTTQQLRLWANKLGLETERSERRESVLARLRTALYEADGHLHLSAYDAWLQTAVDWADAKYAIALAEEAEDEDRR